MVVIENDVQKPTNVTGGEKSKNGNCEIMLGRGIEGNIKLVIIMLKTQTQRIFLIM